MQLEPSHLLVLLRVKVGWQLLGRRYSHWRQVQFTSAAARVQPLCH